LKNKSSFNLSWRPRTLREPQTAMRVWVILGCFAVGIMGMAFIADTSTEKVSVRTTR